MSVAQEVAGLLSELDAMLKNPEGEAARRAPVVGDRLSALVKRAGYTARPAFHELTNQFRMLSETGKGNPGAVKLLVSRTYGLLASELETTRFLL